MMYSNLPLNRLVSYYFMSSYLYYELDLNVINDFEFNDICKRLYKEFNNITHPHKHLLNKDALSASTGYDIKYTRLMRHAAVRWYEESTGYKVEQEVLIRGQY